MEEKLTVQTATASEKHAPVNESEVCYPNYVTEQYHYEKETFSPEVVAGPSSSSLKPSDILKTQGEDQRPLADSDYILTEIGVHEEDLTYNEQLSRPTSIISYGKNNEENVFEPVTLAASTCEFSLLKSPPAINLYINSDNTTNNNLTTPDSIASTAQGSADSTNSTIIENSQPTGSQTFKRGRKRKCKTDKKYIDYLSDEDFSSFIDCDGADSDEFVVFTDTEGEEIIDKNNKNSKKNKSKANRKILGENLADISEEIVGEDGLKKKNTNTRKERSQKIRAGQEYVRTDGKTIQAKAVQLNPCIGKKCGNNCKTISEEKRMSVFNHFWNLSAERRRDWLASMTQKEDVKRKRSDTGTRSISFKYHINEGEGKRPVCLQFLAATLNVSSKSIYKTVKNSTWGCAKEDLRGKHVPPNKTQPATIESVRNFIKSLPAVPSHYCRHDSTKVYLTQDYKNVASIYKVYQNRCEGNGVDFVSEKVFRKIFSDDFNIGFHVPKKDKCLKCLKFQQADVADLAIAKEKKDHEEEKNESYNRFFAHKNIQKTDPSTLCVSFDLEKVLNTPHGESMLLYYSRKLAVYNLCFYENGTRKVFCYYWDESNGNRGANEIASILHKYIRSVDRRGDIKNLLLYCDCCPGQNRNKVVVAMLHSTLQQCENLETIQINYLLTGHTYMPVDSVHAIIENNLKRTIIYAPSQWYTVFSTARNDPSPYEVERLTYEDFYKWDSIAEKYFKGNLLGKISKIRIATLKKNNVMKIKYSMNKSAKSHTIEVQSKSRVPLMSCYRSRIPIAEKKYDDLLKLCNDKVIPTQFQNEFIDIPHCTNKKMALPASDVDDVDSDNENV